MEHQLHHYQVDEGDHRHHWEDEHEETKGVILEQDQVLAQEQDQVQVQQLEPVQVLKKEPEQALEQELEQVQEREQDHELQQHVDLLQQVPGPEDGEWVAQQVAWC